MADDIDIQLMRRALELAARGRGTTYPNPMVGAVLVKRGRVLGEGYHRKAGGQHAEVEAIEAAGAQTRGGTLYVTLEPCCHTGRTGPCVDAIAAAGVSRVVYAVQDPDERVRGRGARRLRAAGVEVRAGVLRSEAIRLNEAYHFHSTTGRPFVTLKLAQSLDGRIATSNFDSKWISDRPARQYVHRLRSETGAVVVGGGTARKDNPELRTRLVKGRNPFRIVISRSLELPAKLRLLQDNADGRTILVSSQQSIDRFVNLVPHRHLTFWAVTQRGDGKLDLHDFVRVAGKFGLRSLLVEGGSGLATGFLQAQLVDKLMLVVAPKVIGKGIEAIGELGIRRMDDALRFEKGRFHQVGKDMIFEGYPVRRT